MHTNRVGVETMFGSDHLGGPNGGGLWRNCRQVTAFAKAAVHTVQNRYHRHTQPPVAWRKLGLYFEEF